MNTTDLLEQINESTANNQAIGIAKHYHGFIENISIMGGGIIFFINIIIMVFLTYKKSNKNIKILCFISVISFISVIILSFIMIDIVQSEFGYKIVVVLNCLIQFIIFVLLVINIIQKIINILKNKKKEEP